VLPSKAAGALVKAMLARRGAGCAAWAAWCARACRRERVFEGFTDCARCPFAGEPAHPAHD